MLPASLGRPTPKFLRLAAPVKCDAVDRPLETQSRLRVPHSPSRVLRKYLHNFSSTEKCGKPQTKAVCHRDFSTLPFGREKKDKMTKSGKTTYLLSNVVEFVKVICGTQHC